jgi:hypothetical protein
MVLGWKGGDVEGILDTSWKLAHPLAKGRCESWCSFVMRNVQSRRGSQPRQSFSRAKISFGPSRLATMRIEDDAGI